MPITDAQMAKFEEWLTAKGAKQPCPSCGSGAWQFFEEFQMTGTYSAGNVIPNTGLGRIALFCGNCARVIEFAAKPILGDL